MSTRSSSGSRRAGGGEHRGELETQPQVGGVAVGQRSGAYGQRRAAPERGCAHAVDLRGGLLAAARVRRQVDEPAHRLVVGVGVGGGLEAGERVADFRPVVEALVAGDPVRDPGPLEGGFEGSRLRVGAVEDRDRPVVACDSRGGAADGEARLGRRVGCVVDGRGQSRWVGRAQAVVETVGVVADHRGGGLEQARAGAVGELQVDPSCGGEVRAGSS